MFVISIILGVIGIPALIIGGIYAYKTRNRVEESYRGTISRKGSILPALGGAVVSLLAIVMLVLACLTQVPAQNVGVQTRFGKPVDTLTPGLHFKAPTDKVTDMDGTIQQENNVITKDGDTRTVVRLNSTNSQMFVENQLRWRIKTDAAGKLFADWKKFDAIGPGLVQKQLSAALNDTLAGYDPLTIGAKNMTNDEIAATATEKLQLRLGDNVEVVGITIVRVDFDEATQARVNDLQAETARTRVADQRKLTAASEAAANDKLNSSVQDPNVLVSKCLDTQRSMVEKGQSLTGVPGCWPGQGGPVQTLPVK